MNAALIISILTILISLLSLSISGLLTIRQVRTAKDGYALPVVLQIFDKFRTEEFHTSLRYLRQDFLTEHPDVVAWKKLPESSRNHFHKVCSLYDDLARLVAHRIVSEDLVVGSHGTSVRQIWEIVEPFVYEDRRVGGTNTLIYMEDLASRAARRPPAAIHAKLGLSKYRPTGFRIEAGGVKDGPHSGEQKKPPAEGQTGAKTRDTDDRQAGGRGHA